MRKELFGLYYLSHIASFLVLYQCWCIVPVLSMVYIWWYLVEVSSETPIHVLTIVFQLSVSPPSIWRLILVWKILNSEFSMDLGSFILPSLRNKCSVSLTSCMRIVISPPLSTISSGLWLLPSSSGYIKAFRMHCQCTSRLSPFQENSAAYSSCVMTATVWSWLEKFFQEHQRRSLLRSLIVSINNVVWMVMWIYPEIRAQPGILNICNIYLLAPIVSKVNVCTYMHVMVGECDIE